MINNIKFQNAQYEEYLTMPLWEIYEVIFLLLGFQPAEGLFHYRHRYKYGPSDFWEKYDSLNKLIQRSIEMGELTLHKKHLDSQRSQLEPLVVLAWAKKKLLGTQFQMPEALRMFLDEAITAKNLKEYSTSPMVEEVSCDLGSQLIEKLREISLKHGTGKIGESSINIISTILEALKRQFTDKFNPEVMPGTVNEFHAFCQKICDFAKVKKILPIGKTSFHRYCKNKAFKNSSLCKWPSRAKSKQEFWEEAFSKLTAAEDSKSFY